MRKLNRELAKPVLIVDDFGITQQGLNLLMAVSQCLKLGQQGCFHREDTEAVLLEGRTLVPLVIEVCEPQDGGHF